MKKIVHLTRLFYPHIGGVETHVGQIAQIQSRAANRVSIITIQYELDLPLIEQKDKLTVYRIPLDQSQSKLKIWHWFWRNRSLLTDANIIHAHDVTWWLWPLWPLIARKLFTTFHGWEGKFPVPISHKLSRLISAKLSRQTIHVGHWIEECYLDKPTLVTYGGTTSLRPLPKTATKKLIKNSKIKIVFFGRLELENEIAAYQKLFLLIRDKYSHAQIIWLGDGSQKQTCQKLGRVTGLISNFEQELLSADIVFSASYLSMLAAQAHGKLVIGFYSHKLKERYLKTYPGSKWMLIGSDPQAVWQELNSLLINQLLWKKRVESAQKFAAAQTWREVSDQYQKLWQK